VALNLTRRRSEWSRRHGSRCVGEPAGAVGLRVAVPRRPAEQSPPTTGWDVADFLDVDVDQPARLRVLVADRAKPPPGRLMERTKAG
jgi:hypothetical protein